MLVYLEYSLNNVEVSVENGVILVVIRRCAYISMGRYKRLVDICLRDVYDGNTSMYLPRSMCLYIDGRDVTAIDVEDPPG